MLNYRHVNFAYMNHMPMYSRVPSNLKLKAVIAAAYGAFALPLTSWAACSPPSPMGAANGSVLCSGTTAGQYLINATNVQFTNDSTGDMTLSGTSIGLIYARENTANGVSVINQGKMTWSGALYQTPAGGGRALANIGYLNANNFSSASFTNASGASLTMTTASPALANSGLDTVAVAASAANSQATVTNNGSISLTNTATGPSVGNIAIEVLAQNFTVTNSGPVDVVSSASAFTSGLLPRMWSAATGGSGTTTNSGPINITNTHATRTTGSVGIYQQASINSLVDNSGTITITNSSPLATSPVGGIGNAGYANSSGFVRINNTGSVVVDSPSNYVYAAQSGTSSNANPMTIDNSGLLEIKSSAALPDAAFRAAVMVLPRIAGLTALQTINNTASGIIRADAQSYAVVVYQDTPVHLNNAGTITGKVFMGTGADELLHTGGTITGDINLGNGNDTMRASGGALVGITAMDEGDDALTLAAGVDITQAPQFDGGTGTDALTLDGLAMRGFTGGSNNLANGSNLTLWETIHLANAATLQLSGDLFESSAAAQINIDSAATLRASDAPGTFHVYGSVANDGTITLADTSPAADDRITFTGNFNGTGSNVVALDTVLGDSNSASDVLEVNGNTSGVSTLRIVNANGLGAATTGNGILVVKVDGASNGVFTLEGGSITAGHFSYTLHQVGNNWYLQSRLLPPTVSVACSPVELFDSANQVSTCTLTLTHPAPPQGLSVNLNLPASNPRYSTTCTQPIVVPADSLSATCTIVATPNTVANDGDVIAELSVAPATASTYDIAGSPAQVLVKDDDKPSVASPAPIPTMGGHGLLLLSLGLGGAGIFFTRRQRRHPKVH